MMWWRKNNGMGLEVVLAWRCAINCMNVGNDRWSGIIFRLVIKRVDKLNGEIRNLKEEWVIEAARSRAEVLKNKLDELFEDETF
ncbi:UNVERIFIED_CONTAM: hypothetical protein Sangu_1453600 [Sesamum angustifolium]|uniref:Uncharacterized protein n=1 Tax=Sesamum angustifolium TaxID=2727405 RepID=A0AAW2N671_9LAMI